MRDKVLPKWISIATAGEILGITDAGVDTLIGRGLLRWKLYDMPSSMKREGIWVSREDVLEIQSLQCGPARNDPTLGLPRRLSHDSERAEAERPVLYGLLTAADVQELERRRGLLAAARGNG